MNNPMHIGINPVCLISAMNKPVRIGVSLELTYVDTYQDFLISTRTTLSIGMYHDWLYIGCG